VFVIKISLLQCINFYKFFFTDHYCTVYQNGTVAGAINLTVYVTVHLCTLVFPLASYINCWSQLQHCLNHVLLFES